MKAVFRTDASIQIGTGHVVRCVTLARALSQQGIMCVFICRENRGNLNQYIRDLGYKVITLEHSEVSESSGNPITGRGSGYEDWLGVGWHTDAADTLSSVLGECFEYLIVDHYALDYKWERKVRPICKTILVVDDLANRHHECDILVDQNLGREEIDYKGLVPETCRVLTGSDYALLRPEFSEMRERSLARRKKNQLRQVIIAMGGVDQTDKTSRVLRALSQCTGLAGLHITVVLGSTAPHQQNVQREVENLPCSANLQVGVSDMAQLMSKSDLAVGAPGTSSWERACLGLPAILMIVAENQRAIAKSLQTFGAAIIVDDDDGLTNSLQQNLNLLTKVNTLAAMSEAASKITDGRGVERVVHELL